MKEKTMSTETKELTIEGILKELPGVHHPDFYTSIENALKKFADQEKKKKLLRLLNGRIIITQN